MDTDQSLMEMVFGVGILSMLASMIAIELNGCTFPRIYLIRKYKIK